MCSRQIPDDEIVKFKVYEPKLLNGLKRKKMCEDLVKPFQINVEELLFEDFSKIQNEEGQNMDLYITMKCSGTDRLITSKGDAVSAHDRLWQKKKVKAKEYLLFCFMVKKWQF
uniref:Uncharacterized protein n=1 Tax=Lactuca sativa TaxID=4236 RepID=A0A9R1X9L3_LACSA|nr:hypothetical protein LSAT_V11C500278570 [Lactuca sativa]